METKKEKEKKNTEKENQRFAGLSTNVFETILPCHDH